MKSEVGPSGPRPLSSRAEDGLLVFLLLGLGEFLLLGSLAWGLLLLFSGVLGFHKIFVVAGYWTSPEYLVLESNQRSTSAKSVPTFARSPPAPAFFLHGHRPSPPPLPLLWGEDDLGQSGHSFYGPGLSVVRPWLPAPVFQTAEGVFRGTSNQGDQSPRLHPDPLMLPLPKMWDFCFAARSRPGHTTDGASHLKCDKPDETAISPLSYTQAPRRGRIECYGVLKGPSGSPHERFFCVPRICLRFFRIEIA